MFQVSGLTAVEYDGRAEQGSRDASSSRIETADKQVHDELQLTSATRDCSDRSFDSAIGLCDASE
jgi:hypothetical protein